MRTIRLAVLSCIPRFALAALAAAALLVPLAGCGGGDGGGGGTGSNPLGSGSSSGSGSGSGTGSGGSGSGGGTTTQAAVVDKYIGTWVSTCDNTGPGSSRRESLTLKKASATSVTFTDTQTNYASGDCSGNSTGTQTNTGTANWVGTKTASGQTVDEIDIAQDGKAGLMKQIVVIEADGKFYSGVQASDGGTVDANGYPNTLQPTGSTRQ